jgi:hypothetical protein
MADVQVPLLVPVRQHFPDTKLNDVPGAMRRALDGLGLEARLRPGMRVAITAGSRGIAGIPTLIATAAAYLREHGAVPVVVAAMGSHGGGTPAGQAAVLVSLGVTAEAVGAEIRTETDVVELGRTEGGLAVYMDAYAARADGILVINRVKPHTSFHGPYESGLVKMLVVGLGKPAGAKQFHSLGADRLSGALEAIGRVILARAPVLGGVAVLENGREETADLVPVRPGEMLLLEPQLLDRARALLPRLPVKALDLLVIDEMGKNISGTGMDTNVIGRMGIAGVPDGEPFIGRIAVLDLTEASHGNANGMGLADFVTRRFADKIDFPATYLNTLTATFVQRAKLPIVLESDRQVVETALATLGGPAPETARVIRIKNTLMLEHLWCSPAVVAEIQSRPGIEVLGPAVPWV